MLNLRQGYANKSTIRKLFYGGDITIKTYRLTVAPFKKLRCKSQNLLFLV